MPTTYYVGASGNDASAGTSWATRFLTIGKAASVVAGGGDKVYVGAGTYSAAVTLTVSGGNAYSTGNVSVVNGSVTVVGSGTSWLANVAAGDYFKTSTIGAIKIASVDTDTQITLSVAYSGVTVGGLAYITFRVIDWIGDYSGANTDGVGGVVRLNATTPIVASSVNYQRFSGFAFDSFTTALTLTNPQYCIIDKCNFQFSTSSMISISGANQLGCTIQNCYLFGEYATSNSGAIYLYHSAAVSNAYHVVQDNIIITCQNSYSFSVYFSKVGGNLVRNNTLMGSCGINSSSLAAGQTNFAYNNIIFGCANGLFAAAVGEITADYNNLYNNATPRVNVSAGANDTAFVPVMDPRWFFAAVGA